MEAWGFVEPERGVFYNSSPSPLMDFLRKYLVGTPASWTAQRRAGMAIPSLWPMVSSYWKSPCQPLWFPAVFSTQLLLSGGCSCSPTDHCKSCLTVPKPALDLPSAQPAPPNLSELNGFCQ